MVSFRSKRGRHGRRVSYPIGDVRTSPIGSTDRLQYLYLIRPKVHIDTYNRQTLVWKRLFDKVARKGQAANDRTWTALFKYFYGDLDELDHMINSVGANEQIKPSASPKDGYRDFKSKKAYHKQLAWGHMRTKTGLLVRAKKGRKSAFEATPGHQKVRIRGKVHRVVHSRR